LIIMPAKKKPITVGKGTGYTRPVTPGKSPRPVSAKPSQASKNRAAAKTTSSGITRRPDGRAQSEGRSGRQSISKAKVTSASNGKPTGAAASRVTMGQGGKNLMKAAATLGTIKSMMSPTGAASAVAAPRPTAAGTVTAAQSGRAPSRFANARDMAMKKASAIKGSPVVGPRKSFDDTFRDARKAGKKEFSWKGKKYTTDMK